MLEETHNLPDRAYFSSEKLSCPVHFLLPHLWNDQFCVDFCWLPTVTGWQHLSQCHAPLAFCLRASPLMLRHESTPAWLKHLLPESAGTDITLANLWFWEIGTDTSILLYSILNRLPWEAVTYMPLVHKISSQLVSLNAKSHSTQSHAFIHICTSTKSPANASGFTFWRTQVKTVIFPSPSVVTGTCSSSTSHTTPTPPPGPDSKLEAKWRDDEPCRQWIAIAMKYCNRRSQHPTSMLVARSGERSRWNYRLRFLLWFMKP
jgi:hypothetical protein